MLSCAAQRSPVAAGRCFDSHINNVPPIGPDDNKLHVQLVNESDRTAVYVKLYVRSHSGDVYVVAHMHLRPKSRLEYIAPIAASDYDYYVAAKGEVVCSVKEVRFSDGNRWRD